MIYLERFFLFLYFKQKRNETKFLFQRGNKKRTVQSQKKRNVYIPTYSQIRDRATDRGGRGEGEGAVCEWGHQL